jgi:LuxR family transcriptional regulator, maltose regulon positive regulatory protein
MSAAAPAVRRPSADRVLVEGVPFGLDAARLSVPVTRLGSVSRTALVNRLRAARSYSLVTVLAPAGYGKTTLLAQWAGKDERPFAWVLIAEDTDPVTLCRYVAAALSHIEPLDASVVDALGSPSRFSSCAGGPIASALRSIARPLVLVLDDVHLLGSRHSADALGALAEHVPDGSTLVLAGRSLPQMPIPRLRTERRVFEIGVRELALGQREAELLLGEQADKLPASEIVELVERTEGWAAGLSLASLSLGDGAATGEPATLPTGNDRWISDYFEFELLAGLSPSEVSFLTRTAVLDAMSGPLCDAVLESRGSASKLESIEKSNLFIFPLDREGLWFRYHHEFHQFLRRELERREPELIQVLNRRAAAWCEANGAQDAAVSYAGAAGDRDLLARLVALRVLPALAAGKRSIVETWLSWFDAAAGLEKYPAVAVLGAWVHALGGRPGSAEHWLDVAANAAVETTLPDRSASIRPWIAVLEAAMCRHGAERMRADAELAVRDLGAASWWRPTALLLRGAAQVLLGEGDRAEESMADAAEAAESVGATPSLVAALAERSLLAASRGDEIGAEALALQARKLVDEHHLDGDVRSAIAFAASARRALLRGDKTLAKSELRQALELRPQLTHAIPWYAVRTSLELARAHLSLLDLNGARAWLRHTDDILRRRADLGVLAVRPRELEAEVQSVAMARSGPASPLTAAELRLLPLLASHLSFREIGEQLFVSRNTVKTQAISAYRKFGASSRSEAIARAIELGLIRARTRSPDLTRAG